MTDQQTLTSASELAANNPTRFPNESAEYRQARNSLLAEEIELRRHLWRVAELRRDLPPGGEIPQDYCFDGPEGPVTLSQLFCDHDTLIVYSMMYGPQRDQGCPMCSSMLDAWDGEARHIEQRVALAVVARSRIERIVDFATLPHTRCFDARTTARSATSAAARARWRWPTLARTRMRRPT
jgi:predicted dithiol-disulfide oxidoreductase (DUF899 family)